MKKNLWVTVMVCVALAISAATMIPFSSDSVAIVEGLIKFAIFPLFIIGVSLFSLVIRKYNSACDKNCVYSATLPITAYMASGFIYEFTLAIRGQNDGWVASYICCIVAFLGLTFIGIMIPKYDLHKKTDKVAPWSAIVLYVLVVAYSMAFCISTFTKMNGEFANNTTLAFVIAIVFAVLSTAAHLIEYLTLTNKYAKEADEQTEETAEEPAEQPEPEIKEVEKIVYVDKPVEVEKIVYVDKPVEVEKIVYVDKIVEVEKKPEPKAKVVKEKAVVNPDAAAMKKHLTDAYSDIVILEGKDPENFKVKRKGKVILIVQRTTNEYRITFQRKPISATKYMIKYPNACVKAAKPTGEQWFKIVNKGNIEEADINAILESSHKYMEDLEAKALAKKEKAKERIKLKKQKAREKAREKAKLAREKQKAKEKASKAKAASNTKKSTTKAK